MRRARQGRTFEEALEFWSPPRAYQEMRHDPGKSFRLKGAARRAVSPGHGNPDRREDLEDQLFRRLRSGELFSSAVSPDEGNRGRVVVPPETYASPWLSHDPSTNTVFGEGFELVDVEVFSANRLPHNIDAIPDWFHTRYLEAHETAHLDRDDGHHAEGFRHDVSYAHVWIGELEFGLSPMQASIVCELHKAHLNGEPWVHIEDLRAAVGFETAKLANIFRRRPKWRALIRSDGRGFYRLNT